MSYPFCASKITQLHFSSLEEDEDSEEESSDESELSESEDESDSEGGGLDLDVCPPGCDQNIYDNTTQLREKRYIYYTHACSLTRTCVRNFCPEIHLII